MSMLLFTIDREIQSFPDKKTLKEFINTKLGLQEILKVLL